MNIERSLEQLNDDDLRELHAGSIERLREYFIEGPGAKWKELYDIEAPLAIALCQGGAMHYYDKISGIKDFDVWFFYSFNQRHLPCRTIWNWDYNNPKFGRHPSISGYTGRRVDVLVRSIKHYTHGGPAKTIRQYLLHENTKSSKELAKKAVVMLAPESLLGKVVWYKRSL